MFFSLFEFVERSALDLAPLSAANLKISKQSVQVRRLLKSGGR
ncbi:hypothetical protein RBSWK_05819 [Rhodopirellula baltica SWK14]|uniref:Uncharacterized protein n=1 Tax=Rhodopirellula baltica SWK14 TaxID=993516 RepID=L7CAT7_RHOBT|nr:hypothetical protein RBSWK_05819 [Rhodopirellula baltica SWK14]